MYQWDRRYGILEEHEKDMIKALYKYDWYTHILMVKIPKTRTKAYRGQ